MTTMDTSTADVVVTTPDGVRIAARDFGGTGSPVVLLHGAGGDLLHWAGVAPLLTGAHRVVAMDPARARAVRGRALDVGGRAR